MIRIGKTLVSDELIEEKFVCDLGRCKGACCVEGISGAPLEEDEIGQLEANFEAVRTYMTPEGLRAVRAKGLHTVDDDGDRVTPLIGHEGACAYAVTDGGVVACAIEKAYNDGVSSFRKPISCHLYPVRITAYKHVTAVNYHAWDICSSACTLGESLRMPVYRFVRDALVRRFGQAWYRALHAAAGRRRGTRRPSEKLS